MDDIQFWLYIVFGLIYFVGRFLKKKNAPKEPVNEEMTSTTSSPQKTRTFEDLLKEFTTEEEEVVNPTEPAFERKVQMRTPEKSKNSAFEEGVSRQFSDEESKKVYEQSVKRAEGFELEFAPDEHFKSKIQSPTTEEVPSQFASSIRESLSDPEEAKKALIYAEIFNRKY
jgi:hypothetical protein